MKSAFFLGFALFSAAAAYAQSESAPSIDRSRVYVRRFSIGATLNVTGLPSIPDNTTTVNTTTPALAGTYTTTGASPRIGYGVTGQVVLTSHFAVNASLFMHRVGYTMNRDEYLGVQDPTATIDTRTHVVTNEDTRARFYDLPLTLRWYSKSRYSPGGRFFAEGGGALRRVENIRTSIDTTINSGTTNCCDTTPITPARHTTHGFVAGMGGQFIDPFGIRVIPEVRYTRWQGKIFDAYSAGMQDNQVEAMLTLSF
jgi:hypothetical protein